MVVTPIPESREYRAAKNEVALDEPPVFVPLFVELPGLVELVEFPPGGISGKLQTRSELVTVPTHTSFCCRKRNLETPFGPVPPPALLDASELKQTPLPRQYKHSVFMTHSVQLFVIGGQGSRSGALVGVTVGFMVGFTDGCVVGRCVSSNIRTIACRPSLTTCCWNFVSSRAVSRICSYERRTSSGPDSNRVTRTHLVFGAAS